MAKLMLLVDVRRKYAAALTDSMEAEAKRASVHLRHKLHREGKRRVRVVGVATGTRENVQKFGSWLEHTTFPHL